MKIEIQCSVAAPVDIIWKIWTSPEYISLWNAASDDWHTPYAENDLRVGGTFTYRMAAKDGSVSFDLKGGYTRIAHNEMIEYTLEDGREVSVAFIPAGKETLVTQQFEPEHIHAPELQRAGWQAILNRFKKTVETLHALQPLQLEILIHAPVAVVYTTMLDESGYKAWTKEFNPESRFIGTWEKGSTMHFLGTDKEGQPSGMMSKIVENRKNECVRIMHLGFIKGEQIITDGPEIEPWIGACEQYLFIPHNNDTLLTMKMDTIKDYYSYFELVWPKALQTLKTICEKKVSSAT